jgi:hypothetical protein
MLKANWIHRLPQFPRHHSPQIKHGCYVCYYVERSGSYIFTVGLTPVIAFVLCMSWWCKNWSLVFITHKSRDQKTFFWLEVFGGKIVGILPCSLQFYWRQQSWEILYKELARQLYEALAFAIWDAVHLKFKIKRIFKKGWRTAKSLSS